MYIHRDIQYTYGDTDTYTYTHTHILYTHTHSYTRVYMDKGRTSKKKIKMNIHNLTSVSLHTEKLNLCRISTRASFIDSRPKRIPIQFLGPAPKGM